MLEIFKKKLFTTVLAFMLIIPVHAFAGMEVSLSLTGTLDPSQITPTVTGGSFGPCINGTWNNEGQATALANAICPSGSSGFLTNTRLAKTAAYILASGDNGDTVALGGSAFYTLTFGAASGYPTGYGVMVVNEDTGRAKALSISGIGTVTLWPLQSCIVYAQNSVWQTQGCGERWRIPGNLSFFVDATNGNNANDCLAPTTGACATIMGAYAKVFNDVDQNGFTASINVADGTYNEQVQIFGNPVGHHLTVIIGDTTTPANVIINAPANDVAVYVKDYGALAISGVTVTGGTGTIGFEAEQFGIMDLSSDGCGSLASGRCMSVDNTGVININGDVAITADTNFPLIMQNGGLINFAGTITLPAARAFNTTCWADVASRLNDSGGHFTGAGVSGTTGTRYNVTTNSVFNSNGGGANFCPGNVAGSTASGGIYQ